MEVIRKASKPHRFYFAKDNIPDLILILLEKDYSHLDNCINNEEQERRVIIDTQRKAYWFTDLDCFETFANNAVNNLKEELKEITEFEKL